MGVVINGQLMLVKLLDTFVDTAAHKDEKRVCKLVEEGRSQEKHWLAQVLSVAFGCHDVVDGKTHEYHKWDVHDNAHDFTNLVSILHEMRSLFCVKVTDLEQDYWLHELLHDNQCVVKLSLEVDWVADDHDELED